MSGKLENQLEFLLVQLQMLLAHRLFSALLPMVGRQELHLGEVQVVTVLLEQHLTEVIAAVQVAQEEQEWRLDQLTVESEFNLVSQEPCLVTAAVVEVGVTQHSKALDAMGAVPVVVEPK
jgi:hypothetical protein